MPTKQAKGADPFTPEFLAAFEAGYSQWQRKNLDAALHALTTEYCPKSQSEMALAWRTLEDDHQTQILNQAIKTFMREAYTGVKLLSVPSVYAKLVEVFEGAIWEATSKEEWM